MSGTSISAAESELIALVKQIFGTPTIPLHRPVFEGNERAYLINCIESNYVSSVGEKVLSFEREVARFVNAEYSVATVNGTSALHTALLIAGTRSGDEVLTQALTFVATCNAISYTGARPVFIDVDKDTLGMSPRALRTWLEANTKQVNGRTINIWTGARVSSCLPMHTFGLPCRIKEIAEICDEFGIFLIEDAAESLGSFVGSKHTGTYGKLSAFSFNGNKIITTGGGGMIVTNDPELAAKAKHITTTAKIPHSYDFFHDEIGYNYRLPNLNAALGCAQMEKLEAILAIKAEVADQYRKFCADNGLIFLDAPADTEPNFWINGIILENKNARDAFLNISNAVGVMSRPIWRLMSDLPMFRDCQDDGLENSRWLADRVVNLPSSVPNSELHRLKY